MQKADAENVSAAHASALPTRLYGAQIAASPTSQITYQGKNQGVTMSSVPNTPRLASANVRVVGTRHSHIPPTAIVTTTTSRLSALHVLCKLNMYSTLATHPCPGRPYAHIHLTMANIIEPYASYADGGEVKLFTIAVILCPIQNGA